MGAVELFRWEECPKNCHFCSATCFAECSFNLSVKFRIHNEFPFFLFFGCDVLIVVIISIIITTIIIIISIKITTTIVTIIVLLLLVVVIVVVELIN